LYFTTYYNRFLKYFIMTHGETSTDPSAAIVTNVESGLRGGPSQITIQNELAAAEEEKKRIFEGVERVMELFRKGESSCFQTSARVLSELEKWTGATDKERGKAFDSHLAEINSFLAIQDENRSTTRDGSPPTGPSLSAGGRTKRIRDEVEELLDQVSRGGAEGEDDEPRTARRRVREEEMPWHSVGTSSNRRASCVETCRTLLRFSEDLHGVKSLLRVASNLPEGIPSSQWDRMLRGESVDLNQILSSMHFIQLDEERKGRVGTAEVVFSVAESKKQIKTGAEWSSAF
jgi:hypothetical protein